jgi:restriction endonuclease S subunit
MQMSKTEMPSIRFYGFDNDWEQRKLGELVDVCSGRDYKHLSEGTIPVYGTGGYMLSVNDALSYDRDAIGIGRKGTIDRPYILKAPFWTVDTLFYAIPREKVDLNYAFDIFQNIDWKKKDESTGVPSLSKTAINDIDVLAPKHDEQQIIGQFFAAIDNLITLHQRKFEKLTNVKKSMLEKMFPQNGSCYPAVRFKGFTDPWEQRKAIDIADYSKGNGYSKGDLTDAGTPIILYGRLYTKYQFAISEVDTFAVPRNGAVYSQGNEVIVPASGETAEDIARASAVEKSGVLLGGDLNILRPFDFINPLFLALAISNGEPQKELAKKAQGKSVVHIHNTDIQEVTIAYPSRTEQDRIVSVFCQLDHLITLHQRELEKLQSIKKALLEKMFV